MSEITFICRECGTPIKQIFTGDGSGTWVSECGHVRGIWLDGGTLDLGVVESDAERKNDFWIFTEPH